MNLILFGKIFGAISISGASIAIIVVYSIPDDSGNKKPDKPKHDEIINSDTNHQNKKIEEQEAFKDPITLYMISEEIDNYELETTELKSNDNNFTCRTTNAIGEKNVFDCKIYEFKNENTKNHYKWRDIDNHFTTTATQPTLKTKNKIFKVEFNKFKWNESENSSIEIIYKNTTENKIYANLNKWITKEEQTIQTQYFIGKSNFDIDNNNQPINMCKFENTTDSHICEIFDFSNDENSHNEESTYNDLIFNKNNAQTNTITTHKHYLIKFTSDIEINNSTQQTLIYQNNENQTFKNLKPDIYNEDLEQIFIIDNQEITI